ncbi:UNVERIFIED_CONTAM: hypothetical protein FKN15_059160 [Acipenser sinensis]
MNPIKFHFYSYVANQATGTKIASNFWHEIKPQSHYNQGYSESLGRKSTVDDYSTWDIVKATQSFFDHSMHSVLPLGIYLATKFWIVALFYNFGKSWKSDPGIIKASEEQKKKTGGFIVQPAIQRMDSGRTSLRLRIAEAAMHCRRKKYCYCNELEDSLCNQLFNGWILDVHHSDCYLLALDVLDVLEQYFPFHVGGSADYVSDVPGITTNERMNARRYKHFKVTTTSIESPFNHGCVRNIIDFFEYRCCGLIRLIIVDWTKQYTIEYDQTTGSGYQLV